MVDIDVVRGDLTRDASDAIVNAANAALLGGGGVDGAIHAAAGPAVLEACRELRRTSLPQGLPTGDAVATVAGYLPSTWVIHTVGPKAWEHDDGGRELLAACHRNALRVADGLGCASIAFPAISCGVYGWAAADAAPIAIASVRQYFADHPASSVQRVRFVLFNDSAFDAFAQAAARS